MEEDKNLAEPPELNTSPINSYYLDDVLLCSPLHLFVGAFVKEDIFDRINTFLILKTAVFSSQKQQGSFISVKIKDSQSAKLSSSILSGLKYQTFNSCAYVPVLKHFCGRVEEATQWHNMYIPAAYFIRGDILSELHTMIIP